MRILEIDDSSKFDDISVLTLMVLSTAF